MTQRLTTTIEQRRSGARVIKFAGVLDEHSRLRELTERVGTGVALINLAGVERINSSGTRDWVDWLASLEANGTQPILVACSPAVVAQLNRIKNFAGNAAVKSFQVPYHCAACSVDKLLLVNVADMGVAPHTAPACICDVCQGPMTCSDETGDYFAFLGQLKRDHDEATHGSEPDLARGSKSRLDETPRPYPRAPLLRDSRPSLSAYQLQETNRLSELELKPRALPAEDKKYTIAIVAIVAILVCIVGILLLLLLV